eukprot:TRINITY_DN37202_c0_g1_i1.p1 TRINITY_DN37202_c0_g1~~TRINITY_DN37202_c0_g1_i1.p1  ORF type:complete len:1313 (-),score=137.29 TRINITY_DN37202_c0_g1_i1:41-3979(-)
MYGPETLSDEDAIGHVESPSLPHVATGDGETKQSEGLRVGQGAEKSKLSVSRFVQCIDAYCRLVVRCPCCLIIAYVVLYAVVIVAWLRPLNIDPDFSSFIVADGASRRQYDAYSLAGQVRKGFDAEGVGIRGGRRLHRSKRSFGRRARRAWHRRTQSTTATISRPRRLGFVASVFRRSLTFFYEAREASVLDERVLREIRTFENALRALPKLKEYCNRSLPQYKWRCDPGETFGAFAWASVLPASTAHFKYRFDGRGRELLGLAAVFAYLRQSLHAIHDLPRFFPRDFQAPLLDGNPPVGEKPPKVLKAVFSFFADSSGEVEKIPKRTRELGETWNDIIVNEVYPFLLDSLEELEHTNVWYFGDRLTDYEISRTLRVDVMYGLGSAIFIFLYLLFHTRGFVTSLGSLIIIACSAPLAFVLTPAVKTSITSFVSIFLILGIGSDIVFVFTDIWEQSEDHFSALSDRLRWTVLNAGGNCLASTLTTAASFFANLKSCLQPLREFGFFMGTMVVSTLFLVFLILPSLLVLTTPRKRQQDQHVDQRMLDVVPTSGFPSPPSTASKTCLACGGVGCGCCKVNRPCSVCGGAGCPRCKVTPALPRRRKCCSTQACLVVLMRRIESCPGFIVCFSCVLVVVFVTTVAFLVKTDASVPEIFPHGHNQVQWRNMQGLFAVSRELGLSESPPDLDGIVCSFNASVDSLATRMSKGSCALHWCEAASSSAVPSAPPNSGPEMPAPIAGSCWRAPTYRTRNTSGSRRREARSPWDMHFCRKVIFDARVEHSSTNLVESSEWRSLWAGLVENLTGPETAEVTESIVPLPPLVLESWESGSTHASHFFRMGRVIGEIAVNDRSDTCHMQTVCFFGKERCSMNGWQYMGVYSLSQHSRALQPRSLGPTLDYSPTAVRSLSVTFQARVPEHARLSIRVVWGLRPSRVTPLVGEVREPWAIDPTFDISNPWAQRAVRDMCSDFPDWLAIVRKRCWVESFMDWLLLKKRSFPTRDFDNQIFHWFRSSLQAADSLWVIDGVVKIVKVDFVADVRYDASAEMLLAYKSRWDRFVHDRNCHASFTANRAWHTASSWVRAEAEKAIVDSTIETIVISAGCGCIGIFIFTGDPTLVLIVMLLLVGVISGLAFVIVVVLDSAIGPIEVISLVIFIGYAITFFLHVAHIYHRIGREALLKSDAKIAIESLETEDVEDPLYVDETDRAGQISRRVGSQEQRIVQTRHAVLRIGGSTLNSAVSTIGSNAFLLLCTMSLFTKLGALVIAVGVLSCFFAMVTLPATLILVGPPPEPWYMRLHRSYFGRLLFGSCSGRRRPE